MSERPALLLVHGAWHGSWCWTPLRTHLEANGWRVGTVDLPSAAPHNAAEHGMHDDADTIRSAINGPTMIVAHSYGGIPATQAATPEVEHIVYVAAFLPEAGDSLIKMVGGTPPPWWRTEEDVIHALNPETVFFNDVDEPPTGMLRPQSRRAFTEQVTSTRRTPSTYVISEKDNAIPPPAQEAMAARATATERLDAGHSPFLSCPQDLAAIIERVSPPRRSSRASG
ncbi:alpha/beta fold hydrolase [Lentzea sp. NPDC058436]|uniref:alpha/beta fold hydrolase n=1 Tax=Lentzea sp. NPDC058436 TaxID=3346499 RepID=UPI00364C07A3